MTTIRPFNADAQRNNGYQYTTNAGLSSLLSNRRITQAVIRYIPQNTKTIIDIGCGDGAYTQEIQNFLPKIKISGFDPASAAISVAQKKYKGIHFFVADLEKPTTIPKKIFDIGVVRGVLHHLSDAESAVRVIAKLSDVIIVVEPNGRNPLVKIIEKLSAYHRMHEEKSYNPSDIKKWFASSGKYVLHEEYIGYVPFFCPKFIAKFLYFLQPTLENFKLFSSIFSGQVVIIFGNHTQNLKYHLK